MILENFSEIYDEDASNELKKQILKLKDELLAREIWGYFDEILNTKITVQECERYIRLYLEAEEAVLKGQEYTIDGQNLKRADLEQIRKGRIWWENKKAQIESGTGEGIRFFQIVPHEF